ncbi:hypothetical protein V8J88_05690 [Massilia sp. W12]|uniref:hypothetical protein n=1 Tax=Massilia sp. W12 TaxID=3126507 RepID=UPI0030D608DE
MPFLNPLTGYAFTKISGCPENQAILLSFLNAVPGLAPPFRIQQVRIQNPYLAPVTPKTKPG